MGEQSEPAPPALRPFEKYCSVIAHYPCSVCWGSILCVVLMVAFPFVAFPGNVLNFDLGLDAFTIKYVEISNRVESMQAAECGGQCARGVGPGRRLDDHDDPDHSRFVAIYASADNTSVLTEERMRQALELENQLRDHLGEPVLSGLRAFFPNYPAAEGALTGAAFQAKLYDSAKLMHDTRNWGNSIAVWPSYEKHFTECHMESRIVTSTFAEGDRDMYPEFETYATSDLYLAFFPEREHVEREVFGKQRSATIVMDALLLGGVLLVSYALMAIMTRSIFIATAGMLGIVLSAAGALFFYRIVASSWFGILNAIAFFLLLGIGCDDIFVLSDTWRQATEVQDIPADECFERLKFTMPRAGFAILTTSLTTAFAFFGNMISVIPPLRLFGLYSGFMVLVDCAMTVTLMPAVLVIQQKYFARFDCYGRWPAEKPGSPRRLEAFFVTRLLPKIMKGAPALLIICAILVSISLNVAMELPAGGEFHPSELFPAHHNQAKAQRAKLMMANRRPHLVRAVLVSGVVPVDYSHTLNPTDKTAVHWDTAFDPTKPEIQTFVMEVCNSLLSERRMVRSVDACWVRTVAQKLLQEGHEFPTSNATLFHIAARDAWGLERVDRDQYFGRIYVTATVENQASIEELREHYDMWEVWNNRWKAEARARGLSGGENIFHASEAWVRMATIEDLSTSCISAVCVSTLLVALTLLVMMQNVVVVGAVMLHVISVCLAVVAVLVLRGKSLGVTESIGITILVGLSVDYLAHMGTSYLDEPSHLPRDERMMGAFSHFGTSVMAGATTTLLSACFLLMGKLTFFVDIGAFVVCMVVFAFFAAIFPFPATMFLFGPVGNFGQIPCPKRFRKGAGSENAAEPPEPEPKAVVDDGPARPSTATRPSTASGTGSRTSRSLAVNLGVEAPKVSRKLCAATLLSIVGIFIAGGVARGILSSAAGATVEADCPEVTEINFTFNDYLIDDQNPDDYRCKGFPPPPAHCPYYLMGFKPIVAPEVEHVVHHIIIFATDQPQQSCPFTCFDMPDATGMDAGWAVGVGTVTWPQGVGYKIGGYAQAIQMHYNNYNKRSGLIDKRSGLTMMVQTKRPETVMTSINVGLHPRGTMDIPPNETNGTYQVECAPALDGPITVLGYATHAHQLGKAVVSELLRRPSADAAFQRIGDVGSTPYYNFNNQKVDLFEEAQFRTVNPGDMIRLSCSFDSTSRTQWTRSGYGSQDEMCMTFLYAYPVEHIMDGSCLVASAQRV